jgi:1-acyl-sn-glycerol-3-phosphate acyltransferase
MKLANFIYRILVFLVLSVAFFISSIFIDILVRNDREKVIKLIKNSNFYRDLALKLFNIKVYVDNFNVSPDENYIIAPNHLSYIDILALKNDDKNLFVSTHEVKNTFLFGHLARYGGSLFINRQSKNGLKDEIETLKSYLKDGFNIVIFLEGTTSNGDGVLPFKSSFVEVAFQTGSKIVPVCIKYTSINDEPINEKNRDLVYYYGEMSIFNHLLKFLLNVKSVELRITFLDPINSLDFKDRKELSKYIHSEISKCYLN